MTRQVIPDAIVDTSSRSVFFIHLYMNYNIYMNYSICYRLQDRKIRRASSNLIASITGYRPGEIDLAFHGAGR